MVRPAYTALYQELPINRLRVWVLSICLLVLVLVFCLGLLPDYFIAVLDRGFLFSILAFRHTPELLPGIY